MRPHLSLGPARSPWPRPTPARRLLPCARTRPTASGEPRCVASACRRRQPGGVRGPHERMLHSFSMPLDSAPHCLLHFSHSRCISSLAPHRALALPTPPPSPPVKLVAGGPPSPTIARTLLRLTLRHPVLASGSLFEQGRASLSGFTAVGHGAAALDLAVERASPFLLSPLESPSRVRHPLADPCTLCRAWSWPATAVSSLSRCRGALDAGVAASPRPPLGQVGLGPEPEPGRLAFLPARLLRPKAAMG
jgi:hypothetical protein